MTQRIRRIQGDCRRLFYVAPNQDGLCLSWLGPRLWLRREEARPGRCRIRKQRGEIAVESNESYWTIP